MKNTEVMVPTPAAAIPALTNCPPRLRPDRIRERASREPLRCGLTRQQRALKRGLDLALCLITGLPALLVVGLCALAVRLETPGPALFCQRRTGRDGKSFRMWKLRTMVSNAEELKVQLAHLNELPWPDFKITNDPRITKVGSFLRRTSLDELPQLWNVLRGEMSWVGPRPTDFGPDRYQLWHTERLDVVPGLTGLWQVLARAQCSFDERLRLDLAYVRGWSLRLELAILWRTIAVVLTGKGAK
jgi:lipopolysaccharide/colanic/teichoic acid biosynthesis glycosyltransferase